MEAEREALRSALERIRRRCRRVSDLCAHAVERGALSQATPSAEEHGVFIERLEKRLFHERTPVEAAPTSAARFAMLWQTLADMVGPIATAMLFSRAAKYGALDQPELRELAIVREGNGYTYVLPGSWSAPGSEPALGAVLRELRPLLVELAGPVILRRIGTNELRAEGRSPERRARR